MHANKPEMAREWEAHTSEGANLPARVHAKRGSSSKARTSAAADAYSGKRGKKY